MYGYLPRGEDGDGMNLDIGIDMYTYWYYI